MKRIIASAACALIFAGICTAATPTFNKDIAPILYQNCATCHRPGEVAPFPLLTYQDAAKRAKLISTVTGKRYMPPWKAEPGYGSFANERRLTIAVRYKVVFGSRGESRDSSLFCCTVNLPISAVKVRAALVPRVLPTLFRDRL